MEFQSPEAKAAEMALKDLVEQSQFGNDEKLGRRFVRQFNLSRDRQSGTFSDQIKKLLNRDLTPEEDRVLLSYYRLICQVAKRVEFR